METHANQRQFLFICGIARSGTTALTRIVNAHENITIGLERFKMITRGAGLDRLTPELYDENSFFNFADGHTNICPSKSESIKEYYDTARRKFPSLAYIGDKVPNSFREVRHIHANFPRTKYLFIVRDIYDTAHSWQARAQNESDNWAAHKDATNSVYPWNETILTYLRMKAKFPDDFYLVHYKTFFDASNNNFDELTKLCDFLNLKADAAMKDHYSTSVEHYSRNVKAKQRELPENMLMYINEHANFDAYAELTGLNVQDVRKAA